MFDENRHVALTTTAWDPEAARAAIRQIVADAAARYDPERLWPAHPLDEPMPKGATGLYFGAAGVIWALQFLRREGVADSCLDFAPLLPRLLEANRKEFAVVAPMCGIEPRRASYLIGDLPILLLMIQAGSGPGAADELHQRIQSNLDLPLLELMWGAAGAMLACVFASEMTGEGRWRSLFETWARRLLGELEVTESGPLWRQTLYGETARYLGPVHGYAGNMQALLRGWAWLSKVDRARISAAVSATLAANAWRSEIGATWRSGAPSEVAPSLVQYCHGAPGMVTVFADQRVADPETAPLLQDGGRLVWRAGALAKGSNLCHGTGGNGFAFLKLHRLTGEPVWLDRARTFAMTAMDQCAGARAQYGRGRYSLWTGDLGLAVYLNECLIPSARFPTVDVF